MHRKAVPARQVDALLGDNSTAKLLEDKFVIKSHVTYHKQNSKLRDFFRHARLLLPNTLYRRVTSYETPTEQRKVAEYQSRGMASLNSSLHLVPFCVAVALLVLHWTSYWVGRKPSSPDLQFAAKMHEITMQGSIVDILVYTIRTQALHSWMPLGALSGAAQAPQLSYLWSLDFFSALTSGNYMMWQKTSFAVSVCGLLFLNAVVGPSSALLMIPQPGMSYLNDTRTLYYNLSDKVFFPELLHYAYQLNLSNFDRTADIETYDMTIAEDGRRDLKLSWPFTSWQFTERLAGATNQDPRNISTRHEYLLISLPTVMSTSQLVSLGPSPEDRSDELSANTIWTLRTWQPLVRVTCTYTEGESEDVSYLDEHGSKHTLGGSKDLRRQMAENYSATHPTHATSLWIAAPGNSHLLLGLFPMSYGNIRSQSEQTIGVTSVNVCAVSAYWRDTLTTLVLTGKGYLIENDRLPTEQSMSREKLRPITIDPRGIYLRYSVRARPPPRASSLGKAFVDILASLQDDTGRNASQTESHNLVERYDRSVVENSATRTEFQVDERLHGYGYGSNSMPTKFAVAIITIYSTLVFVYVFYIISTGHTSTAWTSVTEIVMLALQSREPDHLGHISVGADSMETFRKSVGIRVRTAPVGDTGEIREKLELVFEHDQDSKEAAEMKTERNKAY